MTGQENASASPPANDCRRLIYELEKKEQELSSRVCQLSADAAGHENLERDESRDEFRAAARSIAGSSPVARGGAGFG